MNELEQFVSEINTISKNKKNLTIYDQRKVINLLNDFLFTWYDGIGTVKLGSEKVDFFQITIDFGKRIIKEY